jgi:hypothetical protein
MTTTTKSFKDFKISRAASSFIGDKVKIRKILDQEITVYKFIIEPSNYTEKGNGKRLKMQIDHKGEKHIVFTGSAALQDLILQVPPDGFPFTAKIVEVNEAFEFQ